jgi:hypothetical protein
MKSIGSLRIFFQRGGKLMHHPHSDSDSPVDLFRTVTILLNWALASSSGDNNTQPLESYRASQE